ncbi:MAG: PQQ-like beta-propeller repeat protein [Deltaproteobacteria bacterium]|nr:PQQ-like beta-propeller repeat protein [Deltaproteobacteria bacterium]MBW2254130.1 PQQ-like beta-propeller repeat protein [Deltaproteobacteria bacterium]
MSRIAWFVLLAACSARPAPDYEVPLAPDSPWPKFRRTAVQDGRGLSTAAEGAGEPWTFATGKGIFSAPVIGGDGTVYLGSADRVFYALGPDGSLEWSFETGEIIDSAALLDDRGLVYFGSGDGHVYALDAATGDLQWSFAADEPEVNDAFIRWFEGNVAMLPSGDLVVPNDNFFIYGLDRESGEVRWRFRTLDQTWSSPAVDAESARLYIGNNNLVGIGGNVFALDGATGEQEWASGESLGSVAASPLLADGRVYVGGFDGYLRAYDAVDGEPMWAFGARDHLYASPGRLSDGTMVQPAADGTVYALDPHSGSVVWAFDTPEPIRSSPAIGADDLIYFGAGDGRLYVLDPDGTLRWSIQLVEGDRNDLNSSPALGWDGIVLAGESGEVFFVPYDWCLENEDPRCASGGEELPDDGMFLYATSRYGSLQLDAPAVLEPTEPLALSLVAREAGDTFLALIETASVDVAVTPDVPIEVVVSADRRFLTVVPSPSGWEGEEVTITVSGQVLVDPEREGLRFEGGNVGGVFAETFTFALDRAGPSSLPGAAPGAQWELYRLAAPLPAILPSYNQIGFDALHYLVGLVEFDGTQGVAWVIGATADGAPDPSTRAMFPVEVTWGEGGLVLQADGGMSLEVMNAALAIDQFRVSALLDSTGAAPSGAVVTARTACDGIPFYGVFLRRLGFCNPDTDVLHVFGASLLEPRGMATDIDPGPVEMGLAEGRLQATLSPPFALEDHRLALLALDAETGAPVPLAYGTHTRVEASDGVVTVSVPATSLPPEVRVWLMVDCWPAAVVSL